MVDTHSGDLGNGVGSNVRAIPLIMVKPLCPRTAEHFRESLESFLRDQLAEGYAAQVFYNYPVGKFKHPHILFYPNTGYSQVKVIDRNSCGLLRIPPTTDSLCISWETSDLPQISAIISKQIGGATRDFLVSYS